MQNKKKKYWISLWSILCLLFTLAVHPCPALADEPRQETLELSFSDRSGKSIEELQKDPAKAALLSALFFGLGHMYAGDVPRGTWILLAGSGILAGSLIGFAVLKDRPPDASSLGNLVIIAVLAGYHLWNIRDAFITAENYNENLEKQFKGSWLSQLKLSYRNDTLLITYPLLAL